MDISKLNNKLRKLYDYKVSAIEDEYSIILSGKLDRYEDIIKACELAVDKKSGKHVVNDIELNNAEPIKVRKPIISDNSLNGCNPDVLIIGGGINGVAILRELSRYKLDLLLVDKEPDLANQASSRNDGEIHPGVDLNKGSLKQAYVKKGNRMYDQVAKELDVDFKRIGQYVGFTNWLLFIPIFFLCLHRKYICGIDDTKFILRKDFKQNDSKFNPKFKFGIYNSSSGVISPYELTIAYGENAIANGAKICLNTIVNDMEVVDGRIRRVYTNRGTIYPKLVINAAGVFADDIAKMANDRFYSIHPRKGTITILDKKANYLINTIASIKTLSLKKEKSKGGGILRTIHDNLLAGPDAIEVREKEDYSTDISYISNIIGKQSNTVNGLNARDIITYFAGIRACSFEEDFILSQGKRTSNIIHVAGMQSPGLTTAPAVAIDMANLAVKILSKNSEVKDNEQFNPIRKGIPRVNQMSLEDRDKLIKDNPDYGVIVCRCEEISKGEILDALNSPLKVATIDGVKRRVRPGMGRCQGTFCMPLVAKIIAEHEGIDIKDVKKSYENTNIGFRNSKEIIDE